MRARDRENFFGGLLAIAFLSGGCINFQEETLFYWHDVKADRVLIHITYSGIHGDTGLGAQLTTSEEAELLEAVGGRQVFLFNNLHNLFDLDEVCAELATPPAFGRSAAERLADQARRDWFKALAANVRIWNGPFFMDQEDRLSAVQYLTISNVSQVIRAVNRAWQYQAAAYPDDMGGEAALLNTEPVNLNGNQLILRQPIQAIDEPEREWGGTNRVRVEAGVVTMTIGSSDPRPVSIQLPVARTYVPNAVAFVRVRFGLVKGFDPEADAARFFGR